MGAGSVFELPLSVFGVGSGEASGVGLASGVGVAVGSGAAVGLASGVGVTSGAGISTSISARQMFSSIGCETGASGGVTGVEVSSARAGVASPRTSKFAKSPALNF